MSERRKGVGRILRLLALWVLLIVVAAAGGIWTAYVVREVEVRQLQQRLAKQKEDMTAQIHSLEKQILQGRISQLEEALARAKLQSGLEAVLDSLTEVMAHVEQRNFGRAIQKIDETKRVLDAAGGATATLREALVAKLDEIQVELEQLGIKVVDQIASLAKDLEKGMMPGQVTE